jgi:hypothetical protein
MVRALGVPPPGFDSLQDVSPDGKQALLLLGNQTVSWQLQEPEQGRTATPLALAGEPAYGAGFSPDGRWVVYSERRAAIYVQPFPGPGLRKQIASPGGFPLWRKDGSEIVIFDGQGVWSVPVSGAGSGIRFGAPQLLFSGLRQPVGYNASVRPLAVSHDGSRFYLPVPVSQPDSGVIHVGVGWVK